MRGMIASFAPYLKGKTIKPVSSTINLLRNSHVCKTEVVSFSLQVFIFHNCKHLQIRDAVNKLISKTMNGLCLFFFKVKVSVLANYSENK